MCLGKGRAAGCVSHASIDAMRHQRGRCINRGIVSRALALDTHSAPPRPDIDKQMIKSIFRTWIFFAECHRVYC